MSVKDVSLRQSLLCAIIMLAAFTLAISIYIERLESEDLPDQLNISQAPTDTQYNTIIPIPTNNNQNHTVNTRSTVLPKLIPKEEYMNTTSFNPNPLTWQQLNEQQFCKIETSPPHIAFFQHLYNIQFPKSCSAPSTKFLIYDIYLEKSSGLGASLFGNLLRYFTTALMLNRAFVLNGGFDWSRIVDYCADKNGMECYFLPLSNCNPLDLLSHINVTDPTIYYEGNGYGPTNCIFGDNDRYHNLSHCTHKIIYINAKSSARPVKMKAVERWCRHRFNLSIYQYQGILTSFLLRPQPIVRDIVFQKIVKSVNKSLHGDMHTLDATKTMSLPIRASDKCNNIGIMTGQHYTHKSEIDCFTPFEYVFLMNAIKYLTNDLINTVILTSEDASFVQMVIDIMKNETYSKVYDWNIVINTEDYSVGEGTTTYQRTQTRFGNRLDDDVGTSFYTDHIISAISSLILQVHLDTQYFAVLRSSSWTKLMWNWISTLNCNVYNPDAHIIGQSKCIGLNVPGYQAPGRQQKFIELPEDICHTLQHLGVTRDSFYDEFGIYIGAPKWQHFCEHFCD